MMVLELKITYQYHQAKIAKCCQMPLVAPIAPKNCTWGEGGFNMLHPGLQSNLFPATAGIQALTEATYNF